MSVDCMEGRLAIGQIENTIRVHRRVDDTTKCLSRSSLPACASLTRNKLLLPFLLRRVRPAEDHLRGGANVSNSTATLSGSHNSHV